MTENLTAALAAVQAELPSVGKDKTAKVETRTGGSYKYSYADLAAVTRAILPVLSKHGLAWATCPTKHDGVFVLRYELRHVSGQSIEGWYPLPQNGTPQELGSALTYARRYCLCSVTGVAPESDDDDAAAASHRRDEWETAAKPPTPEQIEMAGVLERHIQGADSEDALTVVWRALRSARQNNDITEAQGAALRPVFDAKLAELRAEPVGDGQEVKP
jgi:hypothetical protein